MKKLFLLFLFLTACIGKQPIDSRQINSRLVSCGFLVTRQHNWLINKNGINQRNVKKRDRSYIAGDIMWVYPTGKLTEQPSPKSKFYIIKVLNLAVSDALIYTKGDSLVERFYNIDFLKLPTKNRTELRNNRMTTITMSEFIGGIGDKRNSIEFTAYPYRRKDGR